jgi:protein NrfD
MNLKKTVYIISSIAVLIGIWGIFNRLFYGHHDVNYGSYVVWGLWVAGYMFFAGTAAGAYMISTLDLLFNVKTFKGIGKISLWLSLVSLGAALLIIWFDLGHMDRAWRVIFQGSIHSLMAQMVWGYNIFGIIILCSLILAFMRPESFLLKFVLSFGLFMSLFVSGAVGALLGVNASRMFWHIGLLPAQFPFFSLASGAAALMAVEGLFGDKNDPRRSSLLTALAWITIILILVKTYFLWTDFSQSIYGDVPQNIDAVNKVLYGPYWWAFWIIQILIGSLIPVIFLIPPKLARNGYWAGWMGVFVLLGFAAARANIIFPALAIPEIDALVTAFTGPHLSYDYFPTAMEWAVTIGVTGMAVIVFLVGSDKLRLRQNQTA